MNIMLYYLDVISDNTFSFLNTQYFYFYHEVTNYQIQLLRLIRPSISTSTDTIIASAYILPLFNYLNVIINNTRSSNITKLQILQNSIPKGVHST